ncbi:CBS domain-containing protein [Streptantibioticus ferralitis]|uniref:CBS domain-containing protein n=1 Tax=Streptantibioticus ferralitis TaxID=236510 RepID=A0ABT5YUC5_9ACTN|nr:CBS domain-containing protein [Streptantibioticus ferralitis]MDF2254926.1 CBS domain-containing protein [Streptantibioticus ferralitis]
MHQGAKCVQADESLQEAARTMRDLHVGSLPICDHDKLTGIITDRDIVIKCVAEGRDPSTVKARELASHLHWIDADADIGEALHLMEDQKIRRLPVLEQKRLVGVISEADVVRSLPEHEVAEFCEKVYAAR